MSSTTKTNSTTNGATTQTPTNPSWVSTPLQGLAAQTTALGQVPATSYVAPQTALQQQANAQGASTLAAVNPGFASGASDISANSSVSPSSISSWMNPYTSNVINSADALAQQQYGQQDTANQAAAAAAGAFGGSGFAIQQGVLQGQQALDYGNLNAGLLNTAYNTATANAFQNANLGQSAGVDLSNNAAQSSAANVNNIDALAALGASQQATAQAQATAPIALDQAMASLYGQNQFGLFQGQNGTNTSNTNTTQTQTGVQELASLLGSGGLGGLFQGAGQGASGVGSLVQAFAPS